MEVTMRNGILVAALVGAAGCGGSGASPPDPSAVAAAEAAAAEAADRLGKALMAELAEALGKGGPASAVEVCGTVAVRVAGEVSASSGVRAGRTSLRVRNAANAPDPWERKVLDRWAAGEKPAPVSEVVGGELRQMRPILLKSFCVACHGGPGDVLPATAEAIARRYPADAATGYREGDLRGAFTLRVPLDGKGR